MNKLLVAVALAAAANSALAGGFFDEPAVYGGIGYAKTNFNDDDQFDGMSLDDSDNGIHAFGGYRFNRYFAVELGVRDLGQYSARSGSISVKDEFTATTIGAVGLLPLGDNFSLYGRVGAGVVRLDEKVHYAGDRFSDDDTGGTSSLGLGVEFRPMGKSGLAVRLGWESHFFTVKTSRRAGNYFYDEKFDQRIDSYGLDVAYYFSL